MPIQQPTGTTLTKNADNSFTLAAPGITQGTTPQAFNAAGTGTPSLPSTTFDASALSTPQQPLQFPPAPNMGTIATNAMNANIGIASPTTDASTIIGQEAQQTPAEQKNQGYLTRLADLIRSNKSQATLQTEQESAAGIPGMNKSVNDLTVQLQGLNDQATALALAGQQGGQIQNEYLNATQGGGQDVFGAHNDYLQKLRANQIQQASIAQQSLTVKSALFAAQGNLSLAKDAADKAAQVAFDKQIQDVNYVRAFIDANAPQMKKEEQAQMDLVKAQLDDRDRQIQLQIDNFKLGQAAIADASKNNPNDPQAQYAAKEAAKIDPHDPQYLQKVNQLVAPYGTDLTKRALEMQLQKAQLENVKANTEKTRNDIQNSRPLQPDSKNAILVSAFNFAATGLTSAQQQQSKQTFTNLLNQGDIEGAKNYVIRTAISNLGATEQTNTIGRTQAIAALKDVQSLLDQAKAKGIKTNILSGNIVNVAQKLGTTNDPDLTYISSRIQQELQVYRRAMTGVAFSPAESAQYKAIFPDITNTDTLNTTKISALVDGLDSNNRSVLSTYIGDKNYDALFGASNTGTLPNGQASSQVIPQEQIPAGYYQASDGLLYKK